MRRKWSHYTNGCDRILVPLLVEMGEPMKKAYSTKESLLRAGKMRRKLHDRAGTNSNAAEV
jgi:hypothetical protein